MPESYLEKRLATLKITEDDNTIPAFNIEEKEGFKVYTPDDKISYRFFEEQPVFSKADKALGKKHTGNIIINYFEPDGRPCRYSKKGSKSVKDQRSWQKQYSRTRLLVPLVNKNGKEVKYLSPSGASLAPFFTPKVIKAYQQGEKIDTLVLTEGEFKAFKGDMVGLHVVGLPGIQGFYANPKTGEIHWNIVNVLRTCMVKRVVFLTDADTFTINYKPDEDLSERPFSFHSAVYKFCESLQGMLHDKETSLEGIYFYSIRKSWDATGSKGLDDLLVNQPHRTQDIINDLVKSLGTPSEFFEGENLTSWHMISKKLFKRFGLTKAEDFYEIYRDDIGDREFVFKKKRYQWMVDKVEYVRHEDANKYMRIATKYFKEVKKPDADGRLLSEIVRWDKASIIDDYGKHFIDDIPRYDGATIQYCWTGDYQRKLGEFINMANPIDHQAAPGEFPFTRKYLKHLFKGEGEFDKDITGDVFTVALDWLTIMHQHPEQRLPVPCLVSKEKGTGKTTFINWLQIIYGFNAIVMNKEFFNMNFNAHFAGKFLVMLDESMLEQDKKSEKEKLKENVTGKYMMVQQKGVDVFRMPNFTKYIILSNDEDRVLQIDSDDTRWFIVKVLPFGQENEIPDLLQKMTQEIPAWLDYISTREIHHPLATRLWFRTEHYITEQFKVVAENTKTRLDKLVGGFIKDKFLDFKKDTLKIPALQLTELLNKTAKFKLDETDLKDYLKNKCGLRPEESPRRYKFPLGWHEVNGATRISWQKHVGRYYTFKVEEWLNEKEMESFRTQLSIEFDEDPEPDPLSEEDKRKQKLAEGDTPANF